MKNSEGKKIEINEETLLKLHEWSLALLQGDYTKRIVVNFEEDITGKIINNLNLYLDSRLLNSPEKELNEKNQVHQFVDIISSFANHDFKHKLPVSDKGTILDAIASGINMLGEELEQSTVSRHELEYERNLLNEAQAIAKIGSWEYDQVLNIFHCSNEFQRIFDLENLEEKNLITQFINRFHKGDAGVIKLILNSDFDQSDSQQYELRIINTKGETRYISFIANSLTDPAGKLKGIRGTAQDITERKLAEIELNQSLDLAKSQNMRLHNFSYIVSHNLRSNVGNLDSLLEMLKIDNPKELQDTILDHLKTISGQLNETISHLHDIVSIQNKVNLIIEPLSLRVYVKKCIDTLKDQITLKKAIINNNVEESVIISHNPAYLESIILNFLSNAIKYSHPERQPEITINCLIENGITVLSFKDNGIGIDLKKFGDKLFGMYKTFNGNKDARGIGLFITKNQIEALKGKITVDSTPGTGTEFKIYFA